MTSVREAVPSDAPELAALLRAINDEPGMHPGRISASSVLRDLIGDPRVVLLVAGEDAVQGFASAHPYYDSGHSRWGMILNDLFVAPEARRRGLGRALVAATARRAATAGGSFLWWDADHGDALALAFHRGIGAVEQPTISFILCDDAFRGLL